MLYRKITLWRNWAIYSFFLIFELQCCNTFCVITMHRVFKSRCRGYLSKFLPAPPRVLKSRCVNNYLKQTNIISLVSYKRLSPVSTNYKLVLYRNNKAKKEFILQKSSWHVLKSNFSKREMTSSISNENRGAIFYTLCTDGLCLSS